MRREHGGIDPRYIQWPRAPEHIAFTREPKGNTARIVAAYENSEPLRAIAAAEDDMGLDDVVKWLDDIGLSIRQCDGLISGDLAERRVHPASELSPGAHGWAFGVSGIQFATKKGRRKLRRLAEEIAAARELDRQWRLDLSFADVTIVVERLRDGPELDPVTASTQAEVVKVLEDRAAQIDAADELDALNWIAKHSEHYAARRRGRVSRQSKMEARCATKQ